MMKAAQIQIIGRKISWRLAACAFDLGATNGGIDDCGNTAADVVLQVEDVDQGAIVAIGPDLGLASGMSELGRDANAVARLANMTAQDVLRTELLRNLPAGHSLVPKGKARSGRDHHQLAKAR
ncbi:hypothetical protein ACVWZV_002967 [Bradyrhizobium sp. GM5.1]